MARTIFYSWQSDLDKDVARYLIRDALSDAIKGLAAELEEAERPDDGRPVLDSDTKGVPGSPAIVETILNKIREAAVFVADVTPIALSESGKACANPNVLIEMGHAIEALGLGCIIQVWNTAFPGAEIGKLPFDMAGRRGPIAFELPAIADDSARKKARGELAGKLKYAIRLVLDQLPQPEPEEPRWHPSFPGHPEIWFDPAEPQVVNVFDWQSTKIRWKPRYPGYVRIIPSGWDAESYKNDGASPREKQPALLAMRNRLGCYGGSDSGAIVYLKGNEIDGDFETKCMTKWFEDTGEIWGVGSELLFLQNDIVIQENEKKKYNRITLNIKCLYEKWMYFLYKNSSLLHQYSNLFPIHVQFGIPKSTE